jgi:hypothetical protein
VDKLTDAQLVNKFAAVGPEGNWRATREMFGATVVERSRAVRLFPDLKTFLPHRQILSFGCVPRSGSPL